ncbi:hypothetical protein F4820DRAFT_451443 [Hypoxylon rubiginosum]|uniref:Uncharacterized protein n=1 Tax=Hypoxylon rubiginosum TaxID=110542 RepID=A0ACB9YS31_9PEZI|nr:hypothetical protein F4820DRAFT_451443 [Hypoxylon rubiginosum]
MSSRTSGLLPLRSKDGVSTFISPEAARFSGYLRGAMVNLAPRQMVVIDTIEGTTLDKVVQWLEDYAYSTELNPHILDAPPHAWVDQPEMALMFLWLWGNDEELFDAFRAALLLEIQPLVDMAYFTIEKNAEKMSDSKKQEYQGRLQSFLKGNS